jgi:hypothetical protein
MPVYDYGELRRNEGSRSTTGLVVRRGSTGGNIPLDRVASNSDDIRFRVLQRRTGDSVGSAVPPICAAARQAWFVGPYWSAPTPLLAGDVHLVVVVVSARLRMCL